MGLSNPPQSTNPDGRGAVATDMTIAWELYFQAQGLAPAARCGQQGCTPKQPHVLLAKSDVGEKHEQPRRQLMGFCEDCWQHTHLRHGREDVADMTCLFNAGVFTKSTRIDPRARLKGRVTTSLSLTTSLEVSWTAV